MGQLVDGVWTEMDVREGAKNDRGEFLRKPVTFRGEIRKDGLHPPESGRYHLYVSYACPWAHRTLIFRALKGLAEHISVDVVSPVMLGEGWSFLKDYDELPEDSLFSKKYLRDIYTQTDSKFTGRVTVPILWDKKENTIVNNESSEIIRFFNSRFNELTGNSEDFYPENLRSEIELWNEKIYHNINNGVYRCGFARSQEAYEEAFHGMFKALDEVENQLEKTRYLVGEQLTEADLRLFPTLVRFDSVYHTHFKCNGKLIAQYPNMTRLVDEIRNLPGVEETIHMGHIKHHYYFSHTSINPSQVVPLGPL